MKESLSESILKICEALNNFSVEYLIVGGTAVALHGYYRPSININGQIAEKPDLDFWYNPTYKNYFNLLNTLESLGQDVTKFKNEQTPNPDKSYFKYEFVNFTVDFIPHLKAPLKFRNSYNQREIVTFNNIEISFINYDDLIKDKKMNARPKDILDIEKLSIQRKTKKE